MIEVHVQAGEHIDSAIKALVSAAQQHGSAKATFNDVQLVADANSTASGLLSEWSRKQEEAAVAYRNSPEGKAAAADHETRIQSAQETHDRLVQDLATLDFKNDVAVLDWICAIQDSTDHVGVAVNKPAIASAFAAAGYEPAVNIGKDFKPDDRDNVFRYIVGQALNCLQSVAIHGMTHTFVANWKDKFLTK